MSLQMDRTSTGKPCIRVGRHKYRKDRTLISGDISWRCLGRSCVAAVRTNSAVDAIVSHKDSHTGPHPMTMQRLSVSPRVKASTPCTQPDMTGATPASLTPVHQLVVAAQPSPYGVQDEETENVSLREQLDALKSQMKAVLDHSVESDLRLLQYTNEVFETRSDERRYIDQITQTEQTTHEVTDADITQNKDKLEARNTELLIELAEARQQIKRLEEEITRINRPCNRCEIWQEETNNMLDALRTIEIENKILKSDLLNAQKMQTSGLDPGKNISTQNESIVLSNSFEALAEEMEERAKEENYTLVVRKRNRRGKKYEQAHKEEKKTLYPRNMVHKYTQKPFQAAGTRRVPFREILIHGDSHARHIAGLLRGMVESHTAVSGVCKPGAGLQNIAPNCPVAATADNSTCLILIGGANDVAVGNPEAVYRNLERILYQQRHRRVLLSTLPYRYDLPAHHPTNDDIACANTFITQTAALHPHVDTLDFSKIKRRYFTRHGLHLSSRGKLVLAGMILDRLDDAASRPRQRRQQAAGSEPAARSRPVVVPVSSGPIVLPHNSFADAVRTPPTADTTPQHREESDTSANCGLTHSLDPSPGDDLPQENSCVGFLGEPGHPQGLVPTMVDPSLPL